MLGRTPSSRVPHSYAVPSPPLCAPAYRASTIWVQAADMTTHRDPLLRDAISCSGRCSCSSRPRGSAPSDRAHSGSLPVPPRTITTSPGGNGAAGNDARAFATPMRVGPVVCTNGAQVAYATAAVYFSRGTPHSTRPHYSTPPVPATREVCPHRLTSKPPCEHIRRRLGGPGGM
ncbi:hypothetical protein NDU88_007102 [Pleurodeles waltl]|uniref:Uncharacterized protein n=1 Tax=Pleurodeles waltl TaxID=8319 RepID=A0AAV7PKB5_PLEWA|nr:hypothetical protein NDU88_007102 [Pleurodeles waltl]